MRPRQTAGVKVPLLSTRQPGVLGTAHARGLVILYRPRLFLNRSWVELGGRFAMAEFMDGNFLFRVVCIYAPNRNPERDSFLLSCSDFKDPSILSCVGILTRCWIVLWTVGGRLPIPLIVIALPPYVRFFQKHVFLTFGVICIPTSLPFLGSTGWTPRLQD